MKYHKYIFVSFILISSITFSQITFNNLDSLLTKNFETVNNRDSISYLSLINQATVFNGKKVNTKADSLIVLQSFTDAFHDLIESLTEMTLSPDFTVEFFDYQLLGKNQKLPENGSIRLHVNMIINNNFSIKMPMVIVVKNGQYSIESPMTVMFLEEK